MVPPSTTHRIPPTTPCRRAFPQKCVTLHSRSPLRPPPRTTRRLPCKNYFRANFKYSLTVQRGHSNDAMLNFLSIKKGYCEQFSGTFAAMARSRRLADTSDGRLHPRDQLRADGLYHVAGRHAHAWDEVWFDGFGWVSFDPTPGRGAPGAERHTGDQPAQDTRQWHCGRHHRRISADTDVPASELAASECGERSSDRRRAFPRSPLTNTVRRNVRRTGSSPRSCSSSRRGSWACHGSLNRWSRRREPSPADRVTSAWAATVRSLALAGAPRVGGATPLEYAKSVDVGKAETVEIARLVTRAVYSPRGVDNSAADRSELLRSEVDAACRTRMSLITRVLDHLDPRSAWERITG